MKHKFSVSLTLALIVAMLFTSVGLADEVYADGDNVAPVAQKPLNLGNVCVGETVSGSVLLAIRRQSNINSDTVFANSSTVTISVGPVSGAGLSAGMGVDYTVTLPSNWQDASTGTMSINTANSSVTLNATGLPLGAYVGTIQYDGSGNNSNPPPDTITRSGNITINANIVNCMQSQTINVTTSAPSNAAYGSSFNVAATATSDLPVAITSGGVCSGSGSGSASITMTSGTGICTVYYNQAGNSGYYAAPQVTNTINAQKASASINVSGYSVTFDNNSHTAIGTATGALGENLSSLLDLSGTTHTDAGTYNGDPWSFGGNDNHNAANGTVDDYIGQAPVTATAGSGSGIYNSFTQSPPACVVTGDYKGDLSCANNPSSVGPDAGIYSIVPDVSGTGLVNFAITPVNGSYEIEKADAICTISGFTGTYDSNAHGATGSCTGVNGEDLSAGLNLGASFTDYPGGTAFWTFSGGTNYNDQSGGVAITINKAPVTATAGSGSSTYDGASHSPSACVVSGDYTGDLTCANNPASVGPNAGTYPIAPVVSGTGLTNFEISSVLGSYTIDKADATINVSGYTGYYDGASHCATGSATGVLGEDLSSGLALGSCFTNVPGGTANWTFSGGTNYNDANGSVAIVINAWTLNGFYKPVDMTPNIWNTIKGGQTVPLKFNVFAGTMELTDVSAIKSFTVVKVVCSGTGSDDDVDFVTTGGTSLRYDATAGQFVQNWQTPKGAGSCYRVTMTTQDLSTIIAFFKTK